MADSAKPSRNARSAAWSPELRDRLLQQARDPNRSTSQKALEELARRTRWRPDTLAIFQQLAGSSERGVTLALDYLARLPKPIPLEMLRLALPMLSDKTLPAGVRLAATGKLLASVPDRPEAIRPILHAATRGLSRSRILEWLIQLQSRVRRCESLDRAVLMTEVSVKLRCPKCAQKFARTELIRHLWHEHRLLFERGRALEPRRRLERMIRQATLSPTSQKPAAVDMIDSVFVASHQYYPRQQPRRVLQAIAARSPGDRTRLRILLDEAADQHCGLCPVCLDRMPDPVPRMPGPLTLSREALQGEGFRLRLRQLCGHRSITTTTPSTRLPTARLKPAWSAQGLGSVLALPLFLLGIMLAMLSARPLEFALGFSFVGWLVYLSVRTFTPRLPAPETLLVDYAWNNLVPGIGRKPAALRFLIRLCRTSLTHGTPSERMPEVWDLVDQAAVLADRGPLAQQLFAAARVLQVHDGAQEGRERIAGLVGVFEPVFRGQLPLPYLEAAAACLEDAPAFLPGDRQRLALRLTAAAFEAGLFPGDLVAIARFCPRFRHWILPDDLLDLQGLFFLWRDRSTRRWGHVGPADTILELAATDPAESRAILAAHPDALLRIRLDPRIEAELGPVVISRSGVVISSVVTANPDVHLDQVKSSRGGWELVIGKSRVPLTRKLPTGSVDILHRWIGYRARTFMPMIERNPQLVVSARLAGLLGSLAETCPLCQTVSVVTAGTIGVRWDEAITGRG